MFLLGVPVFFLFAIGLILGLVPPLLWGKIGGDEPLIEKHPNLTGLLKLVHHWQIGLLIIALGLAIPEPYNVVVFGWGSSTTLDDIMFHSFESYFERKK